MKSILVAMALASPCVFAHAEGSTPLAPTTQHQRAAAAIATIEQLGGKVETVEAGGGRSVRKVDLNRSKVTDDQLQLLQAFPDLEVLDLRLTAVSDAGIAHLRPLRKLRTLNLFRTSLTDEGLADLAELRDLETLLIGGTRVTDRGMARLLNLASLQKISLFDTRVGDEGALQLTGLSALRVLLVDRSAVTPTGRERMQLARPGLSLSESLI